MSKKKGNLIVISGPSGTGKGTVCKQLLQKHSEIAYSISATTRAPRVGEVNGKDYWFLSKEEFQQMINENKLLEWAEVYGNYYGTPVEKVREVLESGRDMLLEIDTKGALNVQKNLFKRSYIYIFNSTIFKRTRKNAFAGRGKDSEEAIVRRLDEAVGEISRGNNYDYIIVNDVVDDVVRKIEYIIEAERCAVYNNLDKLQELMNEKK